jgi:ABC-type transporter Mla subunit MlaD
MTSGKPTASLALCGLYALLWLSVTLLRGLSADVLIPLILQTIAGLCVLRLLNANTSRSTANQIDDYYTTAANSLIGFGMILSAFTILRAANGDAVAGRILSIAPSALAATATGLAGGTFFFVLGHIRADSTRRAVLAIQPPADRQEALSEALEQLTVALTRQDKRLEAMTWSVEQLCGVVSSAEGHSWIETQAGLLQPMLQLAAAFPAMTSTLNRSEAILTEVMSYARPMLAAVTHNTLALGSAEELLRDASSMGKSVVDTGHEMAQELKSSIDAMGASVHGLLATVDTAGERVAEQGDELSRELNRLMQAIEAGGGSIAKMAHSLTESAAATSIALAQNSAEISGCRETIAASATGSSRVAAELQTSLGEVKEAAAQLRTAMTAEQRGLLTMYLENLGNSAAKIAEDVMKHVPSQLDQLLDGVERRILGKIEMAFDRAYRDAEERFKALNDSVGATTERLAGAIAEFKRFNTAFDSFEESVRNGAASAGANATDFSSASSQLAAATRQFTDTVAQGSSPEHTALLTAMRTTVDLINDAARVFSTAHSQLAAEQEQLRTYSSKVVSLRLEAARLRIKTNGAS